MCFDDAKTRIVIMADSSNGEGLYKELLETLLENTYTPICRKASRLMNGRIEN